MASSAARVRLIVGLGNPGPRYFGTRHNAGFALVERLGQRHAIAIHRARYHGQLGCGRIAQTPVALLKPMTFMNRSGSSVAAAIEDLPEVDTARDLLLVYDDLDLPFARIRLRARGGAGGHNGVSDVIAALGTKAFPRLRFGIGRPPPGVATVDHVLQRFSEAELRALPERLDEAVRAIECFVADGIEAAMRELPSEG